MLPQALEILTDQSRRLAVELSLAAKAFLPAMEAAASAIAFSAGPSIAASTAAVAAADQQPRTSAAHAAAQPPNHPSAAGGSAVDQQVGSGKLPAEVEGGDSEDEEMAAMREELIQRAGGGRADAMEAYDCDLSEEGRIIDSFLALIASRKE